MSTNRAGTLEGRQASHGLTYASVSDESSPDTRHTDRVKVPIYAQVLAEKPLDWFYTIRASFPQIAGELKGAIVVTQFESLPAEVRDRVWNGLREVRVHITDPRLYLAERDHAFRRAIGTPYPAAQLRELARQGDDEIAQYLLRFNNELVGRLILWDSRPARMAQRVVALDEFFRPSSQAHDHARPLGFDIDSQLAAVSAGKQSLVTRAAALATKSGPAFADADDEGRSPIPDDQYRYLFGYVREVARRMVARLRELHAFDRGDEKLLMCVQDTRDDLRGQLYRLSNPLWKYGCAAIGSDVEGDSSTDSEPLVNIESSDDARAQAADIAARMASITFQREGLPGVVKRFEYVVFNGARVSERDVDEHLRRWKHF